MIGRTVVYGPEKFLIKAFIGDFHGGEWFTLNHPRSLKYLEVHG